MMPLWTTTTRPLLIAVRMGVLLGRSAVCGPARVADAVGAVQRPVAQDGLEVRELARTAADVDAIGAHDRDACRVVAAVLETAEPVEHHRHHFLLPDVTDDAAHAS